MYGVVQVAEMEDYDVVVFEITRHEAIAPNFCHNERRRKVGQCLPAGRQMRDARMQPMGRSSYKAVQ